MARYKSGLAKLRHLFNVQKGVAKHRGIGWDLSFEEWHLIWIESGHLHERGKGRGKYVMARHNDIGPYKIGNVRVCLHEVNNSEAWAEGPRLKVRIAKMKVAQLGRKRGPMPASQREAISKGQIGKKYSAEAIRNMSKGQRRRYGTKEND